MYKKPGHNKWFFPLPKTRLRGCCTYLLYDKLLTNTDGEGLVTPDSVLAEGGAGTEQGEITPGGK